MRYVSIVRPACRKWPSALLVLAPTTSTHHSRKFSKPWSWLFSNCKTANVAEWTLLARQRTLRLDSDLVNTGADRLISHPLQNTSARSARGDGRMHYPLLVQISARATFGSAGEATQWNSQRRKYQWGFGIPERVQYYLENMQAKSDITDRDET